MAWHDHHYRCLAIYTSLQVNGTLWILVSSQPTCMDHGFQFVYRASKQPHVRVVPACGVAMDLPRVPSIVAPSKP